MNKKKEYFDSAIYSASLNKIGPLLDGITSPEQLNTVKEFWDRSAHYFGVIFAIKTAIESGKIGEEAAYEIVNRETEAILMEGKNIEDSVQDESLIKNIKKLFRECGLPMGMTSEIIKHAFLKPSGYAGDYGIIEIVYDNRILSRGLGYVADRIFLNDDYARAVRSRKDSIKARLAGYLKNGPEQRLEILNIACGSCREIKEMISENRFDDSKKFSFTLIDQDQEALDFSRKALAGAPLNFEFRYIRNSVYDYLKDPESHREALANRDIIYTIGLADYIPGPALKSLMVFLFGLLKPGGKLLIAHKDSRNFRPLAPDWWCDWTFHLRDEAELRRMVETCGIENFSLTIEREADTNIIFFLIIEKR